MDAGRVAELATIAEQVAELQRATRAAEVAWAERVDATEPGNRRSAVNLAHYLAVRQRDVRSLQRRLAHFGLSSLGREEPHVEATLNAVQAATQALLGREVSVQEPTVGFDEGARLLHTHAAELFGSLPEDRTTRIMVTLPSEAARDADLVRRLVERGMDIARINCAHDDEDAWSRMIGHVHEASERTGRRCLVSMDLGGPKVRTGPVEEEIRVREGDLLALTRDCAPADVEDGVPRIGCTLSEVFDVVRRGHAVRLDDGKVSGQVVDVHDDRILLCVTRAKRNGYRLKAEKGINLPETVLPISALTPSDRKDLAFVSAHADLVAESFVRTSSDVRELLSALDELGDTSLGIVLKIETEQGFHNLPELLLTAMRRRKVGVMIARGDLAMECGYERLAELQEEILWICEAAHVPAIWATQVLETMARGGQPSRAEVTDAAMGSRAECVMLNKGPHVLEAVTTLDDILRRMAAHQDKKTSLMRPLRSWQRA